jgi:ATP-binding cassette subfamily C protein
MMGPVQEVLNIQYAWHAARAALNRINALIDVPLEPVYPEKQNPFAGKRTVSVEMRDVSFAYGDGPPVLDHLSIRIPAGQHVALVGASGGGKTTFVQVLLGLYRPKSGSVLFDGVPVEEIGLSLVRDNIATFLQHPALLNDSVRMNLTLGGEATDEQLWDALEIAQLRQTIESMPGGLETVVGNRGVRLSGGQRQRLAIARMVLTDPAIVMLDEATSALDTVTEMRLHESLKPFLEGRTTIIVAHRLSAVRQAQRALVFENGRIVEEGGHEDLIEREGLYASLYR